MNKRIDIRHLQEEIELETLLDAFLCSEKREAFIPKLGYKHPCGLCIKACPVGPGKEHYGKVRDI